MTHKKGIMRVNPKMMMRNNMPCLNEMMVFLTCLRKHHFDDDLCIKEKEALNACVELQAKVGKPKTTINYHLQRLAKLYKKR